MIRRPPRSTPFPTRRSSDLSLRDLLDIDLPIVQAPMAGVQAGTAVLLGNEATTSGVRSEEHTSELQSPCNLVCRLLLEKKKFNVNFFFHVAPHPDAQPQEPW